MVGPPQMAFQLMSSYPEASPLKKRVTLEAYKGKPVVVHLYTS